MKRKMKKYIDMDGVVIIKMKNGNSNWIQIPTKAVSLCANVFGKA